MAERRMFAKSIVLSDVFLDMPIGARALYMTFGMMADDDGFVGNPKAIMRQCNATEDDLKVLLAKRYILGFESGVIVVKHWRINNYLQNDRKKPTTYLEELDTLSLDSKGAYTEKNKCIQELDTQFSKDKNSENKNIRFIKPTIEEIKDYIKEKGLSIDADYFYDYYESNGWKVGKATMKDWRATARNWARRKNEKNNKKAEPLGDYDL